MPTLHAVRISEETLKRILANHPRRTITAAFDTSTDQAVMLKIEVEPSDTPDLETIPAEE